MKTITLLTASLALFGSAFAQGNKQIEITAGANFWLGDVEGQGFDTGWMVGLDYYMPQNYMGMANASSFVGARGWFATEGGVSVNTYGIHYGWRFGMPTGNGDAMQNFYFKIAAGYYNNDNEVLGNKWGFGGFAAVGYTFQGNAGVELGFLLGPTNTGFDNQSWYAAFAFRV
jgi:hypothetical protein